MPITRNDIISKVFTRISLGYDEGEVDSFLDEIMNQVEENNKAMVYLQQENEKLKMQINEISAETNRLMVSRQEVAKLKEENAKLLEQMDVMRQEKVEAEQRNSEAALQAERILADAQKQAEENIQNSQLRAGEIVRAAENKAGDILSKANEAVNQTAQSLKEREAQIMDRAQQRARSIIEAANARVHASTPRSDRTPQSVNEAKSSSDQPSEGPWNSWLNTQGSNE